MKSIGPYVVLREVGVGGEAGSTAARRADSEVAPRRRSSRTLWAAERSTGLPVLLHPLSSIAPAPKLPAHPRLLPFTDLVAEMARVYLVTELPLQTRPARDPLQAARGALEGLDFLHRQGLTHGSLDASQLWEVDGEVRVSGAGLPRPGLRPQPADDLRDLASALEDIGGLPPILAMLRNNSDILSAREMLDLLNVGLPPEQLAEALEHVPVLSPEHAAPTSDVPAGEWLSEVLRQSGEGALFDEQQEIVLGGALADEILGLSPQKDTAQEGTPPPTEAVPAAPDVPVASSAPAAEPSPAPHDSAPHDSALAATHPVSDDLGEFRRVTPGVTEAAFPPALTPDPDAVPDVAPASSPAERPRLLRRAAGRQASERLKADNRRRLGISSLRRQRTAATIEQLQDPQVSVSGSTAPAEAGELPGELPSDLLGTELPAPDTATPQERRRLEHEAWEEQQALDAQLAAARRARPEARSPSIFTASAGEGAPEISEMQRVSRSGKAASAPKPQKRQLAPIRMGWGRNGERQVLHQRGPREELLRWLLPTLGALVLAFAVATLPRALNRPAAPCCTVQFLLQGASGEQRAALTLLQAPESTGWKLGTKLGEAPGTVLLPAPGTYRVKVSAEGYAPARVNITVPAPGPVRVRLGD